MALIKCPECGREVSTEAKACPGCGAPRELLASSAQSSRAATDGEKPEEKSRPQYGLWAILGLLGVAYVLVKIFYPVPEVPKPEPTGMTPWYMATKFVKKQLIAPAEADFPNPYTTESADIKKLDGGMFAAWGHVDSDNAYGAKIRNRWLAVVEDKGNDRWGLIYLEMAGQKIGTWPEQAARPARASVK